MFCFVLIDSCCLQFHFFFCPLFKDMLSHVAGAGPELMVFPEIVGMCHHTQLALVYF